MRISDWSSDVCSSDLSQPRSKQEVMPALAVGVVVAADPPDLNARLDDWRHFLVEWHFEVIVAEQDDSLRLFLQGRIDNRAEVAVRVASEEADDKGRIRRQSGRTRSEEHTSELQSLMR